MHGTKGEHFQRHRGGRDGGQERQGLLRAGRIKPTTQRSSMTLMASHTPWGIELSEGTACSELENFHTAPMAVCRASKI